MKTGQTAHSKNAGTLSARALLVLAACAVSFLAVLGAAPAYADAATLYTWQNKGTNPYAPNASGHYDITNYSIDDTSVTSAQRLQELFGNFNTLTSQDGSKYAFHEDEGSVTGVLAFTPDTSKGDGGREYTTETVEGSTGTYATRYYYTATADLDIGEVADDIDAAYDYAMNLYLYYTYATRLLGASQTTSFESSIPLEGTTSPLAEWFFDTRFVVKETSKSQFTTTIQGDEHTFFSSDAADYSLGENSLYTIPEGGVEVSEDGHSVTITMELVSPSKLVKVLGSYSSFNKYGGLESDAYSTWKAMLLGENRTGMYGYMPSSVTSFDQAVMPDSYTNAYTHQTVNLKTGTATEGEGYVGFAFQLKRAIEDIDANGGLEIQMENVYTDLEDLGTTDETGSSELVEFVPGEKTGTASGQVTTDGLGAKDAGGSYVLDSDGNIQTPYVLEGSSLTSGLLPSATVTTQSLTEMHVGMYDSVLAQGGILPFEDIIGQGASGSDLIKTRLLNIAQASTTLSDQERGIAVAAINTLSFNISTGKPYPLIYDWSMENATGTVAHPTIARIHYTPAETPADTPDDTGTTTTTKTVSGGSAIAQTGDTSSMTPIIVCVAAGVAVIVIALVVRRRGSK